MSKLGDLKKEIEILRQFGNKDCIAMADEHLNKIDFNRSKETNTEKCQRIGQLIIECFEDEDILPYEFCGILESIKLAYWQMENE